LTSTHEDQGDDENDQRGAACLPRRQERGCDHHGNRGQEESNMPFDEVEAVIAETLCDRWAAGEREDQPAHHEGDQAQQQIPVDGPPPLGKRRTIGTADHQAASPLLSTPSSP
jgi:hypothetical protein